MLSTPEGKIPLCRWDFYKLGPSSSQDKDNLTKNASRGSLDKNTPDLIFAFQLTSCGNSNILKNMEDVLKGSLKD
jgi:hypothetical protein